jgi:D-aspartate ligase
VRGATAPTLLCDAGFYGTLAAARCLGRAGIPVALADPARATPAHFSRYVSKRYVCPPKTSVPRFVDWLLSFGAREGTHVLYPTSDEVAYVLSAHRAELADRFVLYQPPLQSLLRVLDKKALLEAGAAAGFDVPETWFPDTPNDVESVARATQVPLMVKPRTQIFLRTQRKGATVSGDPDQLRDEYARFVRENPYGSPVSDRMTELTRPALQRYYPEAAQSIWSVTGFRDEAGGNMALLGAVKVLQRPRRMGVGLCFEQNRVDPAVRESLSRLLDDLGYYGVFEIELVKAEDRLLLIDMNPRFYNQLALDIARGLPLPRIAYAAAVGDEAEVARLVANVPAGEPGAHAFCNSVGMRMLVGAQRLAGTMSPEVARSWNTWLHDRKDVLVDSVRDGGDPVPYWAEAAGQVYGCLRHPRAFLRTIALDR